jgi:hypothetical protein
MRTTSGEQEALGVIDQVVAEPADGAHADPTEMARRLRDVVVAQLDLLAARGTDDLLEARYARYRRIGAFEDAGPQRRARPERHGFTDRLRALLGSGRLILGHDGRGPRPAAQDDPGEPPLREEV